MPRREYHETVDPQKRKTEYQQSVEAAGKSNFDKLYNRYGSNGKMFDTFKKKEEYDKIKIDIPEGLNEDFVTAIVMGAMLRKDRLNKKDMTTSSIGQSSPLDFNRSMITQSFVKEGGDPRQGEFADLLPLARQEAKEAIEEFAQGKPDKAMKMLNEFIDSRVDSVRQSGIRKAGNAEDISDPETMTILLGAKLVGQPPLNARGTYSEHEIVRLNNYQKMYDARNKVNELSSKLMNDPPAPNSPERKKLVEDILLYKLVQGINTTENDYNVQVRTDEIMDRMFENLGTEVLDGQDPAYFDSLKGQVDSDYEILEQKNKLSAAYQQYHISDQQVILSRPNGIEELRKYYKNAILKSDLYKDLVEAEGDDIVHELDDVSTLKYMKEYPDVKLPNVSAEINKSHEDAYNKIVKQVEKDVTQYIVDKELLYKEDEKDYGIKSFSKKDLEKNAKIMSDMYKTLTDNDVWYKRSSTQFIDLKREMKNLKEMAERMARNGTEPTIKELSDYEKKAREVNSLTENYLDYKKVAKGDYAKGRLKAVQNIRRHLGTNLKSILITHNTIEEQKLNREKEELNRELQKNVKEREEQLARENGKAQTKEALERFSGRMERMKKMDLGLEENKKVFLGDKYTLKDTKENVPAGYTVWRTAGFSITIMALAAEGKYTMEQLLDPNQIQKEKQEMFDQVYTRMQTKTDENQKWIARQIYEGQKVAFGMIDEYSKDIDFRDTSFVLDEKENKMEAMNKIVFDAWQEMSHCKNEIVELAQKDDPQIKDYDQLKEKISNRIGPLSNPTAIVSKSVKQITDIVEGKSKVQNYAGPIVLQLIQAKINAVGMDELALKDEKGELLPYTQRFTEKQSKRLEIDQILATLDKGISDLGVSLANDPKAFFDVAPKLLDGSAFKDIKTIRGEESPSNPMGSLEIKGIPTKEQLLADVKYEKMIKNEPQKLDFMKNTAIIKYDQEAEKASPVHLKFIEKSKAAVTTLHDMIKGGIKLVGEKREVAKNCLKDIMAEKFVGFMEKSGMKLSADSEKDISREIEKLPAFEKATDYIGMGELGAFVYEDKAKNLMKESVMEIQKNQAESQKKEQEQKNLENQAEKGKQKDKMNPGDPKIEVPGIAGH